MRYKQHTDNPTLMKWLSPDIPGTGAQLIYTTLISCVELNVRPAAKDTLVEF